MSVDPIAGDFPHATVYNYAENRVPNGIDLWGLQFLGFHSVPFTSGNSAKFVERNPKTALAIAGAIGAPLAIGAAVTVAETVTAESIITFAANEVKDEVLSQATGGLSDVVDIR